MTHETKFKLKCDKKDTTTGNWKHSESSCYQCFLARLAKHVTFIGGKMVLTKIKIEEQ